MDINSKDLTSLKEEIYKELRLLEQKLDSKIKMQSTELTEISTKTNEKMNSIISKNAEIFSIISVQKLKIDKLNEFDSFSNKINDMIVSHELRIKNSSDEIAEIKTKYEKMTNENLIVPGLVGKSSQYKNLSEYLSFNSIEVSKIKIEKDSLKKEAKDLRLKMDSLMKNLLTVGESAKLHCKEYTDSRQKFLEDLVNEKLSNVENKNLEFRLNVLTNTKKIEEDFSNLNKKFDELLKMRSEINELMENKFKEINDKYDNLKIEVENNVTETKKSKNEIQNNKNEIQNIKNDIKSINQSINDINNKFLNSNMRRSTNLNISKNSNSNNPLNRFQFQQRKSIPNIPEIKTLENMMKQLSLNNKPLENDENKTSKIYSPRKTKKSELNTIDNNNACLNYDKKSEDNSNSSSFSKEKKSSDEEENKNDNSTLKLFEKMATSYEAEKRTERKNEDLIQKIENHSCNNKSVKNINNNRIDISTQKNEEKRIIPNENKINILSQINKLNLFKNKKKEINKETLINYNFVSLGSDINIPKINYNNIYTLSSKKTHKLRKINLESALTDVFNTYRIKKKEKVAGGYIGEIPIKMTPAFGRTSYGYFDKKENLKLKDINKKKKFVRNNFSDLSGYNTHNNGKKYMLHSDKLFKSV